MEELENLQTLETNSRGSGGQSFDIQHNVEDQKFKVSDAFYAKADMNNHGFTAHFNPSNENVYLSVRENEEAVSYKGRDGFDKGKEFTSTTMSELMEKVGLTGNLSLQEVDTKNGHTYYRVEDITEETDQQVAVTQDMPDTEEIESETQEQLS